MEPTEPTEPTAPHPQDQVVPDFSAFDDAVENPDGEPMGVVLVDGEYRPDLGGTPPAPPADPQPTSPGPVPAPPPPTE